MNEKRSYYEKACRRVRLARYGVLLFLLLFVIFSMTFFRDEITFDNFRYLMKYIEVSPPSMGGEENVLSISGGKNASALLNEKLVLADDGTVVSYDLSGRKLLSESIRYPNPSYVSDDRYMLIYDRDGTGISICNSFSKVCDKTLSTPIESAVLSSDGGFAVITREKSYAGGFAVYDNRYKKVYSFMTRSAAITDLCYDGRQKRAACTALDAQNGDFYVEVYTFDLTNEDDIKAKASLSGELPLSMFCADKNFALMTDRGIHFYDYDANETAFCDFEYETPESIYRFNDFFAVVLKSSLAGTDTTLRLYDYAGTLLFTRRFSSELSAVHAANGYLYVLEPYELNIFSYDTETDRFGVSELETVAADGEYKAVFSLEDGEYLLLSASSAVHRSVTAPEQTDEEPSA